MQSTSRERLTIGMLTRKQMARAPNGTGAQRGLNARKSPVSKEGTSRMAGR